MEPLPADVVPLPAVETGPDGIVPPTVCGEFVVPQDEPPRASEPAPTAVEEE